MGKDTRSIEENKILPEQVKDLLSINLGGAASKQYTAIPQRLIGFYGSPNTAYFVSQLLYDQSFSKHYGKWVARDYNEWEEKTGIKKKALSALMDKLPYLERGQFWYGSNNDITGEVRRKILHVRINVDKFFCMLNEYLAILKCQNDTLQPT